MLPLPAARGLGATLGLIAYGCLPTQRRLTAGHLRFALGNGCSAGQQRRIVRRVFQNLGQTFMEWLALPALSDAALQRLVAAEGVEHLRQALARGNGAILVTAHFGNWELIPLYLTGLGFKGVALARQLRYPEYESFLIGMRGARGVPTLSRGSLKEVARLLRANQIVGMLPDQDVDSLEGVFVQFFGHPAYTPIGPASLSLMTGAPIVPCFTVREGPRFRLVLEPPLAAPQGMDRRQAATQLTQAWSRVVEAYIRRHPDQWVWMHRRWKTQPSSKNAQGSGLGAGGNCPEPGAQSPEPTAERLPQPSDWKPVLSLLLLSAYCLLLTLLTMGCGKPRSTARVEGSATTAVSDPTADQRMSGFTLTGYEDSGAKRWELSGQGASIDGQIVTIHHPDAVGYQPGRTAYLTASAAQVRQPDRHVRLEHDVTIHTSDGLWFTAPVLHWIPDQDQVATDTPVRIETDHMLVRGRGARGETQLKHATIFSDIELVLNPSEHEREGAGALSGSSGAPAGGRRQVTITCDGPLSFDYENNIATFERNVHVQDPNGDLYADTLIAYLQAATHTIRYAEAVGHVRIHQHQNTALSDRAVYEPAIGKITLAGKPSLLVYPAQDDGDASLAFNAQPVKAP